MIITPEEQVWLAGYGYKREPEGRLHDLWVKALALEDSNGLRSVVVTTDLMGIPRYMYESISRKLMKLQREDGSWINENARWWEGEPVLTTAYALLALKRCRVRKGPVSTVGVGDGVGNDEHAAGRQA